jgi:type I restriction enzyme S subunit
MNADRLLELYERISEAPDAIARLRRFVLDLAVRGKLVEQDPAEDSPRSILKRSGAASLVEGAFHLPSAWAWVTVGAVAQARLGKMLDKAKNKGAPRPYLRNINVRWFDFDLSDLLEMPFEDSELAEFALRSGDVLVCEGGEPGRAAVWDERKSGIYFQKAIHRIRFGPAVEPHFFVLALKASAEDGRLAASFTGTGIKHFTGKGLSAYSFPLPPLSEQRRIVAKVDELMTLCDRLEEGRKTREETRDRLTAASLTRLTAPETTDQDFSTHARFALDTLPALTHRPDQIKALRQTILNLAVRGKLVAQDPAEGVVGLPQPDDEVSSVSVPKAWRYPRLVHLLSEDTRNGYSRRPDEAKDGVPILRISAGTLRRDGIVAEEEHKLISGIDEATRLQYGLQEGDLLACRFNGNKAFVGRLTLFRDYLALVPIYPDKLIRIRLDRGLANPEFIRLAGESDLVRGSIEEFCATTVGNWGISASNLKEVPFPVPPLAEQLRIVAKVDALMALCDRLEAALATADTTRARLLEALLHEALEPAEDVLEAAE